MKRTIFIALFLVIVFALSFSSCGVRYIDGKYSTKLPNFDMEITMHFQPNGAVTQTVSTNTGTQVYTGTYYIEKSSLVITFLDKEKSNTAEYSDFYESKDEKGSYLFFGGYKYYQIIN